MTTSGYQAFPSLVLNQFLLNLKISNPTLGVGVRSHSHMIIKLVNLSSKTFQEKSVLHSEEHKIFSLNKRNLFRKIASLKVRGHEGFTSANVNNRHSWNLVMRIYLCLKYSNIYLVLASWFREVLFLRRLNQFTCTWLSLFTKHFFQGLVTSMQCST